MPAISLRALQKKCLNFDRPVVNSEFFISIFDLHKFNLKRIIVLRSLYISNYALIDELSINFYQGFNIITGETGAGKSIILGALGLIMGQRADLGILQDKSKKCVVEGTFFIKGYQLEAFFNQEEIDYDDLTIFRREITSSGKSRAFINDSPVNLKRMQDLAGKLVDIHSQHQNLQLGNRTFQLMLVDLVAENQNLLASYGQSWQALMKQRKKLDSLQDASAKAKADLDYFEFQFRQLDEARLEPGEQEELESEQGALEHAEEIKQTFSRMVEELEGENGLLPRLKEYSALVGKLSGFMTAAGELKRRLESCYFELKDISEEGTFVAEHTEHDPERIRFVGERLDLIYSLQQKFRVATVQELINLKTEFEEKILQVTSFDEQVEAATSEVEKLIREVTLKAEEISERRESVAGRISGSVVDVLQKLGMVNASFLVCFEKNESPGPLGFDEARFLFSGNKSSELQEISKIASGGEISRVMLALKTLVTDSKALPTIIFDEIDTGISGEVAVKMGTILKEMAVNVQVINITHLPQVAGKGQHHFKVYKYDAGERTYTSIKELSQEERVEELAQMLGGENVSETVRKTAGELLD